MSTKPSRRYIRAVIIGIAVLTGINLLLVAFVPALWPRLCVPVGSIGAAVTFYVLDRIENAAATKP